MGLKIITVASGKGGVGKSTVSANLAVALAHLGQAVGLLDADIYGPSQGRLLGVDPSLSPDVEEGKWLLPIRKHGIVAMSLSFLATEDTPIVWRGPMASNALQQMWERTRWGELDVLLIDMPPGTGDIQLTISQRMTLAGAIIVTTPQDIALIDARRAIEMFAKVKVPIIGLVQNMATHICVSCGYADPIFGSTGGVELAEEYHIPLLGNLPLSRQFREWSDEGQPALTVSPDIPESMAYLEIAKQVITSLAENEETAPIIKMV